MSDPKPRLILELARYTPELYYNGIVFPETWYYTLYTTTGLAVTNESFEALAAQLPKEGHLHRSIKLRDGCSRTMFHSDKRLDTNTRKIQVPDGVEISVEPEVVHV